MLKTSSRRVFCNLGIAALKPCSTDVLDLVNKLYFEEKHNSDFWTTFGSRWYLRVWMSTMTAPKINVKYNGAP